MSRAREERRPLRHVGSSEALVGGDVELVGGGTSARQSVPDVQVIGVFGSFALVLNNISGPGMLDFPLAFQSAGWLPCVACVFGVACASAAVASYLCEAHGRLVKTRGPLEFSGIFGELYGARVFAATQLLYFLNLFSQNVAAIVSTAQAVDSLAATLMGRSLALRVPFDVRDRASVLAWRGCEREGCTPFDGSDDGNAFVLTGGYAFCALTLGPLGFCSLQENMVAQKISLVLLVALCGEFLLAFSETAGAGTVPAIGADTKQVLGVVIFNFAFCVTIPGWLNEKAAHVDPRPVVWTASLAAACGYVAVGYAGGRAYGVASPNVLDELTSPRAGWLTRVSGGVFAFGIIGLGVPIFCVLMRYNLGAGGFPPFAAHAIAGLGPWAVSWLLYRGHSLVEVLNWSGLVLNSGVDFILPMIAALTVDRITERRYRPSAVALLGFVSAFATGGLVVKVMSGDPD